MSGGSARGGARRLGRAGHGEPEDQDRRRDPPPHRQPLRAHGSSPAPGRPSAAPPASSVTDRRRVAGGCGREPVGAQRRSALRRLATADDPVRWGQRVVAALASAVLVACAREPPVEVIAGGSPAEARRQLAQVAARGPVPIRVVYALERPTVPEVAALAARGVSGLAVRFAADADQAGGRLVVALDGLATPGSICADPPPGPAEPGAPLLAAWCDGELVVARVQGPGGRDPVLRERSVWRATARLFPDDYADTYGWNLFGLRITIGGSFGF